MDRRFFIFKKDGGAFLKKQTKANESIMIMNMIMIMIMILIISLRIVIL